MITRTEILNKIIEKYNFKSYLEIGVRVPAENFDKINVSFKESIDPAPSGPCTYKVTSDYFFANYGKDKKYDIIFVDGLHTYAQSYRDVINSISIMNEGGFIVMHDCNPPTEYHIRSYEDYLKTRGQWNGDVFKAFIRLKNELEDWNCFVVDEDFGCAILTKRKLKRKFSQLDGFNENMSWVYFNENRIELLDLISYNLFNEIL